MTTKVTKATSKGQITLPSEWRTLFATDNFLLEMHGEQLIVRPIMLNHLAREEVIFDADRDNNGKGISASQMLKMLKEVKNG